MTHRDINWTVAYASSQHSLLQPVNAFTRIQPTALSQSIRKAYLLTKMAETTGAAVPPVVAKKPRATKPKGDKKPTTQALIKEAILTLKVRLHGSNVHLDGVALLCFGNNNDWF